jgi:hypothetical protein
LLSAANGGNPLGGAGLRESPGSPIQQPRIADGLGQRFQDGGVVRRVGRLRPEDQQIGGGYQALVFSGKLAALYRVTKPGPGDSPHP